MPVVLWVSDMVSIEISRCSSELRREGQCKERVELLLETIDEDLDFLSETCRGGGLSVSLCEHGYFSPFGSLGLKVVDETLKCRDIYLVESFLDGERHGGVVDVLRGESEMDELLVFVEASDGVELFLFFMQFSYRRVYCILRYALLLL